MKLGTVLLTFFAATLSTMSLSVTTLSAQAPPGFVAVTDVVADLVVDMRYAGSHNFVGRPIDGYHAPRCLLTRAAADALRAVQNDLATSGLGLKVFDCYRPVRAVAHFARWARDATDVVGKAEFYPDVDKRDLFDLGFIALRSSHSRGSTVDLTLVSLSDKTEVPMGGAFDFFGARSFFAYPGLDAIARTNRDRLRAAMERRGFEGYAKEWWHFTLRNEPFPGTSFDFPIVPG